MPRPRCRCFPTAVLLAAATLTVPVAPVYAGLMRDDIALQTYRDFAENAGAFTAGATNVPVYFTDGRLAGIIDRVPDFGGLTDSPSAMTPYATSFMAGVGHALFEANNLTFGSPYNTTGLPFSTFGDTYRSVSTHDMTALDFGVSRYSKIIIDAAPYALTADNATLMGLAGRTIFRDGAGVQGVAVMPGYQVGAAAAGGNYSGLAAGTNVVQTVETLTTTAISAVVTGSYTGYKIGFSLGETPDSPLEIGSQPGDSGSPVFIWNAAAGRFDLLGTNSGGQLVSGYGKPTTVVTSPTYAAAVAAAYDSPVVTDAAAAGITMSATNASGNGTLTQGATVWNYVGLAAGVTAAVASDAQLDATRNLIFAGAGNTITLAGSVDLGAGSMTFTGGGTYTLADGGVTSRRLNSAGFIVNGTTTLINRLTGDTGDDWRKLGTGTLRIEGSGANGADLSIGEGLVELNRSGGAAARQVRLVSGRGTVRLLADNQISGDVIFGRRGGTLDLYGHAFTDNAITHFDAGATIANTKAGSLATFTFNGTGAHTYWGAFADGGDAASGLLKVVYAGGAGNSWTLTGDIRNKGGFDIGAGGLVTVAGLPTRHAGAYVDPTGFDAARFAGGAVNLATGATFVVGRKASAAGDFTVADTATLRLSASGALANAAQGLADGPRLDGSVNLAGSLAKLTSDVASGFTATVSASLTGAGSVNHTGGGLLLLTGANDHTGGGTVTAGTVRADALTALGSGAWTIGSAGTLAVDGASAAQAFAHLGATSAGTVALTGADPAPTLHATAYLGALGASPVHIGTAGAAIAPVSGGWRLGGGGGELVVDGRLTGTGTLYVGNGDNTGVLTLTDATNDFSGGILLRPGVELRGATPAALGVGLLTVGYGAAANVGATPAAMLAKVNTASTGYMTLAPGAVATGTLDFSAHPDLALGVSLGESATVAGTLTPGASGYRFGGAGALTVAAALTAGTPVFIDGQGRSGGVITLAAAHAGAITVQGYDSTKTALTTGDVTLRLGFDGAPAGTATLTLKNGGILDLHGHAASLPAVTTDASARIINGAATNATLTLANTADATLGATLAAVTGAGELRLVKSGAGILTLTGANTQRGDITLAGGTLRVADETNLGDAANRLMFNGGTLAFSASGKTYAGAGGIRLDAAGGTLDSSGLGFTTDTVKITRVISGQGDLTIKARGTHTTNVTNGDLGLELAATNTFRGTVNLAAGLVSYSGDSAFGHAANRIVLQGGGLTDAGRSLTLRHALEIGTGDNVFRVFGAGSTATLDAAMTGSGTLKKTSTGKLVFAGDLAGFTGTYQNLAGNTTVSATGTIGGTWSVAKNVGNETLLFDSPQAQSLAGSITLADTTKLQKSGTGQLTLSGALNGPATGAATIQVNAGTLRFDGTTGTGTKSMTVASGATLTGAGTFGGAVTLSAGGILRGTQGETLTLSGLTLSASNSVIEADFSAPGGAALFKVNGNLTLAGQVNLTSALEVDGVYRLIDYTGTRTGSTMTLGGAGPGVTFDATGTAGQINLVKASGALNFWDGAAAVANTIEGGAGTWNATAARWTGVGGASNAAPASTGFAVFSSAPGVVTVDTTGGAVGASGMQFAVSGYTITGGPVALTAGASGFADIRVGDGSAAGSGYTATIASALTGTGVAVRKLDRGTLVLTGANTYDGGTQIRDGVLEFAAGSLGTTGDVKLDGGTLRWSTGNTEDLSSRLKLTAGKTAVLDVGANAVSFATALAGDASGALTKRGAGTLTLSAANTYTGVTTVSAGTLRLAGAAGSLGTGLVANGGTLEFARTTAATVANRITGAGALVQSGAGTLTLTGANDYAGGTEIRDGGLVFGHDQAAGTGAITLNLATAVAAALDFSTVSGTRLIANDITLATPVGAREYRLLMAQGAANEVILTGKISGGGAGASLVLNSGINGGSRYTLAGANTHAGTTDIYKGSVAVANASAFGSTAVNFDSGAGESLSFTRAMTVTNAIGYRVGEKYIDTAEYAVTLAGAQNFDRKVHKIGAGELTLTAANTGAGGVKIREGTLVTGHASALGAGSVTIAGGVLQVGSGAAHDVALGANASLTLLDGALRLGAADTDITLSGTGGFTLAGGVIDLNGAFDTLGGTTSYTLITGGTGAKSASGVAVTGYSAAVFSSVNFAVVGDAGVLSFTAIPEPASWAALASGAALLAAVRRRPRAR